MKQIKRLQPIEKFKVGGIYMIKNIKNNKVYIGSANKTNKHSVFKRIQKHCCALRRNKRPNPHLQSSFNKYGVDYFVIDLVEKCANEELLEKEEYWIEYYKCRGGVYNIRKPNLNAPLSEEHKKKIGDANRGRPNPSARRPISEEAKRKISRANRGRKRTEDHKRRLSALRKGKPLTEETKRKMSISRRGNPNCMGKIGPRNGKSKKIRQYSLNWEFIKEWGSARQAALELGITEGGPAKAARGKRKKAGGFRWKYV